jgi:apolipoprotein N-acyltransferase
MDMSATLGRERPAVPAAPTGPAGAAALPGAAATALALASGGLLVAAFPPHDRWWLAPVSMALLVLALWGRTARAGAGLGLLHGAAFFTPLLSWSGIYVGALPWLLLAGLQTGFLAALGALSPRVLAGRGWPLWWAGLWVAQEALRARVPFGGFPWGRLAFSQAGAPTLGLAGIGGSPLVSGAVALTGALLAAAALSLAAPVLAGAGRRGRTGGAPADPARGGSRGVARAVTAAAAAVLLTLAPLALPAARPDGARVRVAVVQGNVPQLGLEFNAQREAVLRNHVEGTVTLAREVAAGRARAPDLVIWPENAADIDPLVNASAARLIDTAADAIGAPILVGAILDGPGELRSNAGIVWDPVTGPGQRYLKRHPVPFAETVPLKALARRVSDKVDLVGRDVYAGTAVGALTVGPAVLGDVICYEVAYDGLVRDNVGAGAGALVVQTNNATFGLTGMSAQQFAMSRLRAVEHGRWVLVAATSGLSGVIAPDGSVRARSELFTARVFLETITLARGGTLASRAGALPEALLAGLGLLALARPTRGAPRGAVPGASRAVTGGTTRRDRRGSRG